MKRVLLLLLFLITSRAMLQAQLPSVDTTITVRDGKSLAATLFHNNATGSKPVILVQTPYNKAVYKVTLNINSGGAFPLDTTRYSYVFVDWRGFYASKDAAVQGYDRGLDGYDIVEWIAAQPWCNGKVATYGGSALGMIQFQTARHHPPHLVCAMPMIIDYRNGYSKYYYGGVLRREHVGTLERLGFTTVNLITSQPVENLFWRTIKQANDYPEDIAVPLLMVSGWFDHYPTDILRAFHDLRVRSDAAVRSQHKLIMGPWLHSHVDKTAQGELEYPGAKNIARQAALEFFDYNLLGAKNGWPLKPAVLYYQMGENTWNTAESWESVGEREVSLYLHTDGTLSDALPETPAQSARSFAYDPRNPSPSHGGARFNPFDPAIETGPLDIRDVVESRDDVLSYTTDILTETVAVQGGMRVELYFTCDRLDTDLSVRLCDVYPDGRSMILTDGIHRARFREGTDTEVMLEPGTSTMLTVQLEEIAHTFLPGHRIRLVVGGANHPRYDINLNNGGTMYREGDTLVATTEIIGTSEHASRFVFETAGDPSAVSNTPTAPVSASIMGFYPQPFAPGAGQTLQISIEQYAPSPADVAVVNLLGQTVWRKQLWDASRRSHVIWTGRNIRGRIVPPGVYSLLLQTTAGTVRRNMIIVR